MKAAIYHHFCEKIAIETVADPTPAADGAVIRVEATGLCRSDWHGWRGHDPDIKHFPHVPGPRIRRHRRRSRPRRESMRSSASVLRCRSSPVAANAGECQRGNQHICDRAISAGLHRLGLVRRIRCRAVCQRKSRSLPDDMPSVAAAAMGCRLGTAYRAVKSQGSGAAGPMGRHPRLRRCWPFRSDGRHRARRTCDRSRHSPRTVSSSPNDSVLKLVVNATDVPDVATAIHDLHGGGADVSLDALAAPRRLPIQCSPSANADGTCKSGLLTEHKTAAITQSSTTDRLGTRNRRQPRHSSSRLSGNVRADSSGQVRSRLCSSIAHFRSTDARANCVAQRVSRLRRHGVHARKVVAEFAKIQSLHI